MERWLTIGSVITFLSGVFAFSLLRFTHMTNEPSLRVLMLWLLLIGGVGLGFALWETIKLAVAGTPSPIAILRHRFDRQRAITALLGCILLGLNLAFFSVVKPQLGQLVPFTADPYLARLDSLIFGTDPWRLLGWFDHPGMATAYHDFWFVWLACVLMYILTLAPSAAKDRALISYVLLWSVFGPVGHLLVPAAGPIFYSVLGFGDRFASLQPSPATQQTAAYLWQGLVNRAFNPAGGISAMPSLHLATMFWSVIVLRKTKWRPIAVLFTIYIFVGSIVLGWHYAVDGIVGGAGAFLIYWAVPPLAWPFSQKPDVAPDLIASGKSCDRAEISHPSETGEWPTGHRPR